MIFPLCANNLQRAIIKESVSKEQVRSLCTALLAMHVKIASYRLTVLLLCLTVKGPNISTLQWGNDASSFDLQAGRSAIFYSRILPLNLRHSIQLEITLFTSELAPTIQYPAPR